MRGNKKSPLKNQGWEKSHGSTLLAAHGAAARLRSNGRTRPRLLRIQRSDSEAVSGGRQQEFSPAIPSLCGPIRRRSSSQSFYQPNLTTVFRACQTFFHKKAYVNHSVIFPTRCCDFIAELRHISFAYSYCISRKSLHNLSKTRKYLTNQKK